MTNEANKQPEALRLADLLTDMDDYILDNAAVELRRQHSLIAELVDALRHVLANPGHQVVASAARITLSKVKEYQS